MEDKCTQGENCEGKSLSVFSFLLVSIPLSKGSWYKSCDACDFPIFPPEGAFNPIFQAPFSGSQLSYLLNLWSDAQFGGGSLIGNSWRHISLLFWSNLIQIC